MKKSQLLVCGTVLLSVTFAGGASANAQSYETDPDGTSRATATGTITFDGDDDSKVPNPEDPDEPVTPDNPNPKPGDLKIMYVPNFDFGTQKKNSYGMEAMARTVKITKADQTEEQTIPFVTTKDMRTDRTGWTLSCTAREFTNKDDASKTIPSAYVTLEKAFYKGDTTNNAGTGVHPKITNTASIKLTNDVATTISSAEKSVDGQGTGLYSLGFGEVVESTDQNSQPIKVTNGVKFHLPANVAVDDTTYTANFVWTLTPGIK